VKAFLMHRDQDFHLGRELPANEADLTQDLELNTLFGAMAGRDEFLFDVARKAVLSSWPMRTRSSIASTFLPIAWSNRPSSSRSTTSPSRRSRPPSRSGARS